MLFSSGRPLGMMRSPAKPGRAAEQVRSSHDFTQWWLDVMFFYGVVVSYELLFIWVYFHNDVIFIDFSGIPYQTSLENSPFLICELPGEEPSKQDWNKNTRPHNTPPKLEKKSAALKKMMVYFPKKLSQKWWCISQSWWLEDDDPAFLFGDTHFRTPEAKSPPATPRRPESAKKTASKAICSICWSFKKDPIAV